jgi:hypothetical protein
MSCFHESAEPSQYAARDLVVRSNVDLMYWILLTHGNSQTISCPWKNDLTIASMLAWIELGGTLLASSSITNLLHWIIHSMCLPFLSLFFAHCFAMVGVVMEPIVSSCVRMMALYSSSHCSMTSISRWWPISPSWMSERWVLRKGRWLEKSFTYAESDKNLQS